MLADRVDQLRPRQTAGLDRFLNVLDFLRRERAPGQEFWCSVSHQHAAAPNGPPYHLKTVFPCSLLFRDKKNLQVGPSCSNSSAKQTRRQSWVGGQVASLELEPVNSDEGQLLVASSSFSTSHPRK